MVDSTTLVYLTGGTGFIGKNLIKRWMDRNPNVFFYVQTRDKKKVSNLLKELKGSADSATNLNKEVRVVAVSSFLEVNKDIDILINLAGASIAEGRWTSKRKSILRSSRIQLTEDLISNIVECGKRIKTVVQCSAVGFYGFSDRVEEPCSEDASVGAGFSAALCKDWESAAQKFDKLCDRLVVMRLGVVIGQDGGVLTKLLPIFKIGLGGPLGNGNQDFAWIHLDDVINGIWFLIDNESVSGVVNFVAPEKLKQKEFARILGGSINRPAFMPTPGFVMRLAYGEMAEELLLGGCAVSCDRLLQYGYVFKDPDLSSALSHISSA